MQGERPARPSDSEDFGVSDGLWQVLEVCWSPDAADRPDISKLGEFFELYKGVGGGSQIAPVIPVDMQAGSAPPTDEGKPPVSIDRGTPRISQCET
jgi:hypothetical protein